MQLGEWVLSLIREISSFQGCPYTGVPLQSSIEVLSQHIVRYDDYDYAPADLICEMCLCQILAAKREGGAPTREVMDVTDTASTFPMMYSSSSAYRGRE